MYVVEKDGKVVGAFNAYNVFFIDEVLKMNFIEIANRYGIDEVIMWLRKLGYTVKEVD